MELQDILAKIFPVNQEKIKEGQAICDQLAKPIGSLGKMETIYSRLYAMFEGWIDLSKKVVVVYVADNGLVEEGISANPQETTFVVGKNLIRGKTGLGAISQHVGSDICVVDIGCCQDLFTAPKDKVRYGTRNILKEPALSLTEARQAICIGYEKTCQLIGQGYTLFGTGEMGVGNTSTSALLIAALLDLKAEEVTGDGAGLTSEMKAHKVKVIRTCLERYQGLEDPLALAATYGGLDILGMAGTYLACAQHSLPCVVDGVISVAALLLASRLQPWVLDYCFASHLSTEPAYQVARQALDLDPFLLMDMHLGEGSGCPLAFLLMENAVYTIEHMPTFEQSGLNKSDYIDNRQSRN